MGEHVRRKDLRAGWVAGILLGVTLHPSPGLCQQRTVGLLLSDPRAFDGYTLFAPLSYPETYLIDNGGMLVHAWPSSTLPGDSAYLLENGHLLRTAKVVNNVFQAGGAGGRVQELDWDGTVVWDYTYSSDQHLHHHDIERLPNGNVLMIAWELRTRPQAIAAGRNPSLVTAQGLWPDHVIEVQPMGPASGTIVWEWHLWDHLIQEFDPSRANYGVVANHPELVDLNFTQGAGADWIHTNSIDYNPAFDQILISVHNFSEVWAIDHSTSTQEAAGHTGGTYGKGGDLLYRWGNPQAYRAGAASDQKLFGQHDAQWIVPGSQGAGRISIFNNGVGRPGGSYSSVEEIAPPVDADGNYVLIPGSAYGPPAQSWIYTATPPSTLYAQTISGAQRLPNGNTLICDGPHGTFFEVTSGGESVWRYVNPVVASGPLNQGDAVPGQANRVFKVRRYGPDYAGLAGRELTPGGTIELGDEGAILRHEVPDLGDPLSEHLPMELPRDFYTTGVHSPFVIAGDAAPGSPSLIFYSIPDASSLAVTSTGSDVVLSFVFSRPSRAEEGERP